MHLNDELFQVVDCVNLIFRLQNLLLTNHDHLLLVQDLNASGRLDRANKRNYIAFELYELFFSVLHRLKL